MQDLDYATALERAEPPHVVLIGPAPCQGCGAWVEWAGVDWLNRGTGGRHECAPHIAGRSQLAGRLSRDQAHVVAPVAGATLPRWARYLGAGVVWISIALALAFGWLLVVGPPHA